MSAEQYRILVAGAGAIGCSVGGFMAQAGHDVTLVSLDAAHVKAIEEDGLRITGIWGDHHITGLHAQTGFSGLKAGDFDFIYVCVKSYHTTAAAESIKHLVDENTLVCSYQNGLGNAEQIADVLGWEHTFGARVIYGVVQTAPGVVKVTVIAQPTALGVYHGSVSEERVAALAKAMDASGIPTMYTDRIATVLWGKVLYNSALNPLSALLDVRYGVLSETEHTLSILRQVVEESYAVAQAMGVQLEPETPEAYMDLLVNELIPPTAAHYASMREDFQQKRRTEIDALNGAICRYGEEYGVPCPANAMLTRLVHAREHAVGAV